MRIPGFHNFPFWLSGNIFTMLSRQVVGYSHVAVTYLIANQIEANHYGPLIRIQEEGAIIGRPGAPGKWHQLHTYGLVRRAKPYLPSGRSIGYGFLYSGLYLMVRTGGGALGVDTALMKHALSTGMFTIVDTVVLTRCVLKPQRREEGGTNYSLPLRPIKKPTAKEKAFGYTYFGLRFFDAVMRGTNPSGTTVVMIPFAIRVTKFGLWLTWKVAKIPLSLAFKLLS